MVYTRTGGHLGWWHQSESGMKSWADKATADFIQAVLDTRDGTPKNITAAIDDAHNVYSLDCKTDKSIASTQALPGDRDSDSTIFTSDHPSYNINDGPTIPTKLATTPPDTYIRFQHVLLLREKQNVRQERQISENNLQVEKLESIEVGRLLRSRL